MKARERHDRRDWLIIFFLILLGFLCILLTSGWALRFAPNWRLDTSMESRLDPNGNFLNSRPNGYFEPLDPSILTQPSWMNVFLTPGASFATRTPAPGSTSVNTAVPVTPTVKPPTSVPPTATRVVPTPTRTSAYIPPSTATSTPGPVISANLGITKTDGVTTYIAGSPVTYTIVVSNSGPGNVTGAVVSDTKPSQVTSWTWVCTSQNNGASGCNPMSGNANFNDTVYLPAGGSITYTVTANIAVNATGNLVNTASVSVPSGYTDPNTANNSATDTDTFSADLAITKDDGAATYIANGTTTYTVIVTNNGPNAVTGAVVSDTKPAQITNWSWACAAQNGGASGCTPQTNINTNFTDTVNLPNGASITYTVTANISSTATGNLNNTATVNVPAGYTDPNAGNNFDIDIDAYAPSANLAITKTDGTGTYTVGGNNALTPYMITVTNNGPDDDPAAVITDAIPSNPLPQITNWSWTCTAQTGGASGCTAVTNSANFTDTVNLPNGASITYTVNADFSPAATGNLINTATVTSSITDPVPGNNSATDTDTPISNVDLAITKTDGDPNYTPGMSVTYTIVVTNPTGPANATGATVTDTFPAEITSANWTCVAAGAGATCAASGTGNINDTVNVPVGGSLTYTVTANIASSATGNLVNTATVTAAGDTNPGNNSATDTDTPAPSADLSITKTDNSTHYVADATKTYIIVVANAGPSAVTGAQVTDNFSGNIVAGSASWTCAGAGGGTCTAGSGNISDTVNLPVGASVTYTVTATVIGTPSGDLVNTASVSPPGGTTDPNNGNDSATDTDTLITTDPTPPEIGTTPDGTTVNVIAPACLTLNFPITVNGHPGFDFVYYELPNGSGILMDWVVIDISDGNNNWIEVFNWGNNIADTNSNVDFNILSNPQIPQEPDERDIPNAELYNLTGVAINLDGVVPTGNYLFLRFCAPPDGNDNKMEIDAIDIIP